MKKLLLAFILILALTSIVSAGGPLSRPTQYWSNGSLLTYTVDSFAIVFPTDTIWIYSSTVFGATGWNWSDSSSYGPDSVLSADSAQYVDKLKGEIAPNPAVTSGQIRWDSDNYRIAVGSGGGDPSNILFYPGAHPGAVIDSTELGNSMYFWLFGNTGNYIDTTTLDTIQEAHHAQTVDSGFIVGVARDSGFLESESDPNALLLTDTGAFAITITDTLASYATLDTLGSYTTLDSLGSYETVANVGLIGDDTATWNTVASRFDSSYTFLIADSSQLDTITTNKIKIATTLILGSDSITDITGTGLSVTDGVLNSSGASPFVEVNDSTVTYVGNDSVITFRADDDTTHVEGQNDIFKVDGKLIVDGGGSYINADSLHANTIIVLGDTTGMGYRLPLTDGTNGQSIITDGAGALSFSTVSGSGGLLDSTATTNIDKFALIGRESDTGLIVVIDTLNDTINVNFGQDESKVVHIVNVDLLEVDTIGTAGLTTADSLDVLGRMSFNTASYRMMFPLADPTNGQILAYTIAGDTLDWVDPGSGADGQNADSIQGDPVSAHQAVNGEVLMFSTDSIPNLWYPGVVVTSESDPVWVYDSAYYAMKSFIGVVIDTITTDTIPVADKAVVSDSTNLTVFNSDDLSEGLTNLYMTSIQEANFQKAYDSSQFDNLRSGEFDDSIKNHIDTLIHLKAMDRNYFDTTGANDSVKVILSDSSSAIDTSYAPLIQLITGMAPSSELWDTANTNDTIQYTGSEEMIRMSRDVMNDSTYLRAPGTLVLGEAGLTDIDSLSAKKIYLGTQTIIHDGTDFVFNDDIKTSGGIITQYTTKINDLDGDGLFVVGTELRANLGTSIESSEITNGTIEPIDLNQSSKYNFNGGAYKSDTTSADSAYVTKNYADNAGGWSPPDSTILHFDHAVGGIYDGPKDSVTQYPTGVDQSGNTLFRMLAYTENTNATYNDQFDDIYLTANNHAIFGHDSTVWVGIAYRTSSDTVSVSQVAGFKIYNQESVAGYDTACFAMPQYASTILDTMLINVSAFNDATGDFNSWKHGKIWMNIITRTDIGHWVRIFDAWIVLK